MTDKKELKDNELEKELKADELENVDGGYVFHDNSRDRWEVIDDITGEVKESGFVSRGYAQDYAKKHDQSPDEIVWCQLDKLRRDYQESKKKK